MKSYDEYTEKAVEEMCAHDRLELSAGGHRDNRKRGEDIGKGCDLFGIVEQGSFQSEREGALESAQIERQLQ